MKPFAVIDLGSHSVHLDVFEIQYGRNPVSIYSKTELSHLARAVTAKGRIPALEERHLRISLKRLVKKAQKKKAAPILMIATAGFRKAANGTEVLGRLEKIMGMPIQLLKPDRESELGFLGVQPDLKPTSVQVFMDCGGGSTEVSLSRGHKRLAHAALPLGSDSLGEQMKGNPPRFLDLLQMSQSWSKQVDLLPKSPAPEYAWVSGHSVKTLTQLLPRGTSKTLMQDHLNVAALRLLRKKSKKIAHKYGIEPSCVPALLPAATVLGMILKHYKLNEAAITDKGLRDGVARDYLARPSRWIGTK